MDQVHGADRTERKRAEAALRASEERYRSLFVNDLTGGFVAGSNGEVLLCNPTFAGIFGFPSPKAAIGTNLADLRAEADYWPASLQLLKKHKCLVRQECTARRRDGKALHLVETLVGAFNDRGDLVQIQGFVFDDTRRKQAELALKESEMRYRALLEQAADAVVVFDPKTLTILDFNNQACRRLGYTRREFARLKVSDLDVIESAADVRRRSRQVLRRGCAVFETKHRTKRGLVVDVEVRASTIRVGAEPLIQGLWRDITARKRAEEERERLNLMLERRVAERTEELTDANQRLQAIMDSALVGIITLDKGGNIESVNPAAVQIFGYAPQEIVGHSVGRLMALLDQTQGEGFLSQYRRLNEPWLMGDRREVLGRRKNGPAIILEISLAEFAHGRRRGFVAMVRDITERKRLERELMEITERERQRIGHDLHDELGQQLHALAYLAALLEKDLRQGASPRAREAGQLNKYLEEALEMTRSLAHGLQPVQPVPEGLMMALRELAERTRKLYRVDCRFDYRSRVLIHRHSAANHLYRIAQEAVNNAMKHGKALRIRIELAATPQRLILGVRDNGAGIRRPTRPGRGMGLRVMQYRADAISGSLVVQEHPEGGTEVVCTVRRQALLPQEIDIK